MTIQTIKINHAKENKQWSLETEMKNDNNNKKKQREKNEKIERK